jgi:hypothetical protein
MDQVCDFVIYMSKLLYRFMYFVANVLCEARRDLFYFAALADHPHKWAGVVIWHEGKTKAEAQSTFPAQALVSWSAFMGTEAEAWTWVSQHGIPLIY